MAGTNVTTIGNIDTASAAAFTVGLRDRIDGADDIPREVRVERDRSAPRSTSGQQLNALIAPTSSARKLIGLVERMGIPTDDAVHRVLKHLSDQHLSGGGVEPDGSVRSGWVRPLPRPPSR